MVLAGVAIARRLRSGQSEEEAVASLTEEELSGRRVELSDGTEPDDAEPVVVELQASGDAEPPTNGAAPEGAEESGAVPAERGL